MAFTFKSAGYHFPAKWTADQRAFAEHTIKYGVKTGAREADMIRMLKQGGVSYRKTNMLADMSRAKGIEQSKSAGAYKTADRWFTTLEKVRVEMPNKTRKEAVAFMETWKYETLDSLEALELAGKLEAEGDCPSPPCP